MKTHRADDNPDRKKHRLRHIPGLPGQFYDQARWRRLRRLFLSKHRLCNDPWGWHEKFPELANEVDHIVPIWRRPDLAYKESNLQALCKRCHSRKTKGERHGGIDRGTT